MRWTGTGGAWEEAWLDRRGTIRKDPGKQVLLPENRKVQAHKKC